MINNYLSHGLFVEGCQSELQNQAVCQKILEVIKDLPEGDKLLVDALKNGRIGIRIVQNPTAKDDIWISAGAAWDSLNRVILILFRDDLNEIIQSDEVDSSPLVSLLSQKLFSFFSFAQKKKRFDFFSDIVFELCNAANPLLQSTSSPLLFSDRDLFARDIEFKEFKTYQRLANLRNYLSYKYLGILGIEEQYTDDQFEKYMELANQEGGYGEGKSHAGLYRQMWDDAYIECQKMILASQQDDINLIRLKTFLDTYVCQQVQDSFTVGILPAIC